MLRSFINGFIINVQFFSTIPLSKKEIPMTNENIRRAVQLFPILGLIQGIMMAALLYSLMEWTFFSPLAIAFIIWLSMIVVTGAIHLDGWIDSSDAFFSYRDKERRIAILADPRVGAFGLISAIVLLAARFLFIYETVLMAFELTFILIMIIPFLGKIVMGWMVTFIKPVKQSGNGHLFYDASDRWIIYYYFGYMIVLFSLFTYIDVHLLFISLLLFVITLFVYRVTKRNTIAWFGGMNGDIVGGATEGVETILWLMIWLYHYSVMG